jgi:hypothetical protein
VLRNLLGGEKGGSLVREAFEVQNEELGAPVYLHLLEGILMRLAPGAVPLVIPRQRLLLFEPAQAILNVDTSAPFSRRCVSATVFVGEVDLFEIGGVEGFQVGDGVLVPEHGDFEVSIVLHSVKHFFDGQRAVEMLVEAAVLTLVLFVAEIANYLGGGKHTLIQRQVVVDLQSVQIG